MVVLYGPFNVNTGVWTNGLVAIQVREAHQKEFVVCSHEPLASADHLPRYEHLFVATES